MKRYIKLFSTLSVDNHNDHQGGVCLILLAFLLLLLPVLPQVSIYHSDERFYTDSAIYMIQHQDFLTPHYPDGSLRMNKPIITYWALITSYTIWGINYFAARLPFLLAGCITIWLTYQMSLRLFGRRWNALLAAAILASNMQFITLSLRATPDILQALFLNFSLYGFIALIFNCDQRLRNYIFAYFGAALAIETKGLLGVTPIVFVFIYYTFGKQKEDRFKSLIHLPVMILATAFALSWFVIIYLQHGDALLNHFYQDQVGARLSGPKYFILLNIKNYLWGVFRHFMPWSLMLLAGYGAYWKTIHAFWAHHRNAIIFILGWFALLLMIFIGGNICRTRYLIPAYPLLSVLFASLFIEICEKSSMKRLWRWICGVVLGLVSSVGIVLLLSGVFLHWRLICAGLIFLSAALPGLWILMRGRKNYSPVILSLCLLIAIACTHIFVLPVFDFAPSKKLAACILQGHDTQPSISIWSEKRFKFAGQLYFASKGRIKVFNFPNGPLPENLYNRPLAILSKKSKESLQLIDYEAIHCGFIFSLPKANDLWKAFQSGGKEALFKAMQEPCYLVFIRAKI